MRWFMYVLFFAAAGCGESGPPPILLGHVAATTGPDREAAQGAALGIRLAIEEFAKEEVKPLGRAVQVIHTDTQADLDAFESQAVRLAKVNRVVALFGGRMAAEVQRLERARAPLLTPASLSPRSLGEQVFSVGLSPAFQGQALARFIADERKLDRIMILRDDRREEAQSLVDAFERELAKVVVGKPPRLDQVAFGKDAKFAELAHRVADEKTAAVLFAGGARDFQDFRKELEAPRPMLLLGGEEAVRSANPGEVIFLVSPFAIDPELPKTVEFAKKFREAFQEEPAADAALAYDAVRLIVEALKQTPSGESLLEPLSKIKDFPGLTGAVWFGPDHILRRPALIVRIEGTTVTVVKRLAP